MALTAFALFRSAALLAVAAAPAAFAQVAGPATGGPVTAAPALPVATGSAVAVPVVTGTGAAADYPIGPGDLLSVSVYRAPDIGGILRTGADAHVVVPGVGEIDLRDCTASEAAARIAAEIRRKGLLLDPAVNVLVTEVRAHVVQVMGEVGRPGSIALDQRDMRLSTVLARAGAPVGTGSGIVLVIQPDGTRQNYLMADLISGGADRPARSGEVLVVHAPSLVYVSGEVGRPGSYPLEKDMTVGQALALAGGFTPSASRGNIRVTHKQVPGAGARAARVDLATAIEPGDLIMVGRRVF